jgi:hypothetical protein
MAITFSIQQREAQTHIVFRCMGLPLHWFSSCAPSSHNLEIEFRPQTGTASSSDAPHFGGSDAIEEDFPIQ